MWTVVSFLLATPRKQSHKIKITLELIHAELITNYFNLPTCFHRDRRDIWP